MDSNTLKGWKHFHNHAKGTIYDVEILIFGLKVFHRSKNLQEESPLEGRNTLSGGAIALKFILKFKWAGWRIRCNLGRWIWTINGPDRISILLSGLPKWTWPSHMLCSNPMGWTRWPYNATFYIILGLQCSPISHRHFQRGQGLSRIHIPPTRWAEPDDYTTLHFIFFQVRTHSVFNVCVFSFYKENTKGSLWQAPIAMGFGLDGLDPMVSKSLCIKFQVRA